MTSRPDSGKHSKVEVIPVQGDPDMVIIRTRKRKQKKSKKPNHRPLKIVLIVLAVLVVLAVAGILTANHLISRGEEDMHVTPEPTAQEVTYDGVTYRYNENVVTILVLGKDDETSYDVSRPDASCTDVNMLVAYDTVQNTVTVVSIPRDAMVEVDLYRDGEFVETALRQLAVAYSVDVATDEQCAENTTKSVSRLFYGLPVGNYFVIDEETFKEMTYAVGGVELTALSSYPGAGFEAGDRVLLEGESAWSYIRYRDVNEARSAQERMERQIQFVQALLDKVRNASAGELLSLFQSVSSNAITSIDLGEASYLASRFASQGGPSITYLSLTGETLSEEDRDGTMREHIYLDDVSVREAVLAAYYTRID